MRTNTSGRPPSTTSAPLSSSWLRSRLLVLRVCEIYLASQDTRTLVREYNRAVDAWSRPARGVHDAHAFAVRWTRRRSGRRPKERDAGTADGPRTLAARSPAGGAGTEDDGIVIARYE